MQIGELSRLSGVSTRSLRYYEQHGLLTARRTVSGYREFDHDAVGRARTLQLLFELGVSRDLARSILACSGGADDDAHRATLPDLLRMRDRMVERIAALAAAQSALDGVIDTWTGTAAADGKDRAVLLDDQPPRSRSRGPRLRK